MALKESGDSVTGRSRIVQCDTIGSSGGWNPGRTSAQSCRRQKCLAGFRRHFLCRGETLQAEHTAGANHGNFSLQAALTDGIQAAQDAAKILGLKIKGKISAPAGRHRCHRRALAAVVVHPDDGTDRSARQTFPGPTKRCHRCRRAVSRARRFIARSSMRSAIPRSAWPQTKVKTGNIPGHAILASGAWPNHSGNRDPPRSVHRIHRSPWGHLPGATSASSSIRSGAHRCMNGTNRPAVFGKTSASGSALGIIRKTARVCGMR